MPIAQARKLNSILVFKKLFFPFYYIFDKNLAELAVINHDFFYKCIIKAKVNIIRHHKMIIAEQIALFFSKLADNSSARSVVEGECFTGRFEDKILYIFA